MSLKETYRWQKQRKVRSVLFCVDGSSLVSFLASIVAFGVNAPRSIAQMALSQDVPIISSNIIYRVMETIREKVAELLPPIIEFKVIGEANVQASFNIDLKGRKTLKVAGCRVTNGTLEKNRSVRLIRNGAILYDGEMAHNFSHLRAHAIRAGPLDTLRHLKKEVTEARKGMECGLSLSGYSDDFLPGDIIQMYATVTKPALL
jgi:translation initiation factor IF-2